MKKLKLAFTYFHNLPSSEKRITIPTVLTIVRLLSVPLIVAAMINQSWGFGFALIVVSALTDLFDGYIARKFNQKTFLGACLDPIADKVLVLSIFFTLAFVNSPLFSIPIWFVILVLIKELVLINGAFYLYLKNKHINIEPTILGKLTMFTQVLFIIWLFACYFLALVPVKTYYAALGLVILLVLSSLYQYVTIGLKSFFKSNKEKNI
jgi:cardiolipin synthase